MFYWLIELSNTVPGFGIFRGLLNVFRYITFRTGGAMVTGALFVFLFGPWIIDHLRLRQGKGQPIRTDGPQSHIVSKKGTPTMGGLMILSGLVVSTLLWANPLNPYVWIVLAVTLGFGFVGFYDDYLKVTKQTHSGFAGHIPACDRSSDRAGRLLRAGAARARRVLDLAGDPVLQGHGVQLRLVLRASSVRSSWSAPATRST